MKKIVSTFLILVFTVVSFFSQTPVSFAMHHAEVTKSQPVQEAHVLEDLDYGHLEMPCCGPQSMSEPLSASECKKHCMEQTGVTAPLLLLSVPHPTLKKIYFSHFKPFAEFRTSSQWTEIEPRVFPDVSDEIFSKSSYEHLTKIIQPRT